MTRKNHYPVYIPGTSFEDWVNSWHSAVNVAVLPFRLHFTVSDCLYLRNGSDVNLLAFGYAWDQYLVVFTSRDPFDNDLLCDELAEFFERSPDHLLPPGFTGFNRDYPVPLVPGEPIFSTRAGFLRQTSIAKGKIRSSPDSLDVNRSITSVLLFKVFTCIVLKAELSGDVNGNHALFRLPCSLKSSDPVFIHAEPWFSLPDCYCLAVASPPQLDIKVIIRGKGQNDSAEFLLSSVRDHAITESVDGSVLTNLKKEHLSKLITDGHGNTVDRLKNYLKGGYRGNRKYTYDFFTSSFNPGPCHSIPAWWYTVKVIGGNKGLEATGQIYLHSLSCMVRYVFAHFDREGFWNYPRCFVADRNPRWNRAITAVQVTGVKDSNMSIAMDSISSERDLFPAHYSLFSDFNQVLPTDAIAKPDSLEFVTGILKLFPPVTISWKPVTAGEASANGFFKTVNGNNTS